MTDIDTELDDLLAMWYRWQSAYRLARGHAGRSSTCADYRAPTHYDWANGATEARMDELLARAVGEAVDCVPNTPRRWRTALEFHARNLVSGAVVWTSPVLPQDRDERDVLLLEARNKLLLALRSHGVMT